MRLKKVIAAGLCMTLAIVLAACGSKTKESAGGGSAAAEIKYTEIKLGETGTDLQTSIKVLTNRTDMMNSDYGGTSWADYVAEFNKLYPDIEVKIEGITDYAEDSLLRLQSGDWGEVMMIPAVDKKDLSTYFLSYGELTDVETQVNYVNQWMFDNQVYGIPCTAVARGIVYNKSVFAEAGVSELPRTPKEFHLALTAIKENTDAIPLYTNYAAGWTMAAWDDYIGVTATGDETYMNQILIHSKAPFADPGDETHAYSVYKVLYDAVAAGLTEEDFTTTDWESSKSMLNGGQIGCMVLGTWAYPQMQQAGPNADDIGYMPFPITIDGKQVSTASPDYNFAINVQSTAVNQQAAMIFVKWVTEQSGYSYNEGGLPIAVSDNRYPEVYQEYIDNDVAFVPDDISREGEEDYLNALNADSELMIANGGNEKIQSLIENAGSGGKSFDEIMEEWNHRWSDAQIANDIEQQY